jgi:ABC-2 type transport system ATP-binding protein
VRSVEGASAKFLVPQEVLTKTVSQILSELEVVDLSITDPPIDDVIGQIFQSGTAETLVAQ